MKNIHVLPTDKPSKLFKDIIKNELFLFDEYAYDFPPVGKNQHIYITNDEEKLKEGWYINIITKDIIKGSDVTDYWKYIILTTDQSLDGVQAIDDEFLEWFVKNPSCEEVKVMKDTFFESVNYHFYKIIIPQEEFKQEFFKKNKMEQTAVEWLVNLVQSNIAPNYIPKEFIKQAKEMEKQQQDEFAIGFAAWCIWNEVEDISTYSFKELLELYKIEQGL